MSVKTKKTQPSDTSTQRYLPFSQIRDNVMIMKDDSSRLVLKCSTINFVLKSQQEQDAIIMSFQRFLNALDFPIQILVRSSKLDLDGYLAKLNTLAVKQTNPLLQKQTYGYIEFLQKTIELAQIMKKEFYIIIPQDEIDNKSVRDISIMGKFRNFWASINGEDDILKLKVQIKNVKNHKKALNQRANIVKTALESIGIRAKELDKNELVKFLTDYYNPRLESFNSVKTDVDNYNLI